MAGTKMTTDTANIKGYHAHVYYDPATQAAAARVREGLSRFNVQLGSWHNELVGPHLKPMYQVLFGVEEFGRVVPWLMLNRDGLTIFLHPETGDALTDHAERALWMGEIWPLNLDALR